jgi:hypothetical protein
MGTSVAKEFMAQPLRLRTTQAPVSAVPRAELLMRRDPRCLRGRFGAGIHTDYVAFREFCAEAQVEESGKFFPANGGRWRKVEYSGVCGSGLRDS